MPDLAYYELDADAKKDYTLDWGTLWLGTGKTIVTSTWAADSGLTLSAESNDTTTATVWVEFDAASASVGDRLRATNSIVDSDGRKEDWSIEFYIVEQ